MSSSFEVVGIAGEQNTPSEALRPAAVPLPAYKIAYVDETAISEATSVLLAEELGLCAPSVDYRAVDRELSLGSSSVTLESRRDNESITLEGKPSGAVRKYLETLRLARRLVAVDTREIIRRISQSSSRNLLTPLYPELIAGKVSRSSDINATTMRLYSIGSPRSSGNIQIRTRVGHNLTWSKNLFRNPIFIIGLVDQYDDPIAFRAAAILF